MKVLVCSTPGVGHVNPMLAVAKMLMEDGHEVVFLTGTALKERVEASGAEFRALTGRADFDAGDPFSVAPELRTMPPGLPWFRIAMEKIFVDMIPAQDESVRAVLDEGPMDMIFANSLFFGLLPTLLRPTADRPIVVSCGTTFLHWTRDDRGPLFVGLPPAKTEDERRTYAAIADEHNAIVHRPVTERLNNVLTSMNCHRVARPLFELMIILTDHYLQMTVPAFEFVSHYPANVKFIGTLPLAKGQAPLPSWAGDLDGRRKVVLVTQGTMANHNLDLLINPTLKALADEPDLLVVATTGGRPIDALAAPIPANARVATYLPFDWLLPKTDVLVTNGGYGSVNLALSHGIPIVVGGLTEDKADVAARVAWSGAGIDLHANNPDKAAIRSAVRTLADNPAFCRRALQLSVEYARYNAREAVTGLARTSRWPQPLRRAG